jgi:hypothetical protein
MVPAAVAFLLSVLLDLHTAPPGGHAVWITCGVCEVAVQQKGATTIWMHMRLGASTIQATLNTNAEPLPYMAHIHGTITAPSTAVEQYSPEGVVAMVTPVHEHET